MRCHSFPFYSKTHSDYHSRGFQCFAESGWRDSYRYMKYRALWQEIRNEYREQNASVKKVKTVIIGNSLVHLFTPELMKREFPNSNIVNRGIGGDMTETLLERIKEDALVLRPDTIIIEIGGNDLIHGKCLSFIEANYHKLIQEIRIELPRSKIIFLSIPPTDAGNLNAVVPVMNQFLAGLPNQYPNLIYIDTWKYMRDKDLPRISREFLRYGGKDKLHFNEEGYSVWGRLLRPHI